MKQPLSSEAASLLPLLVQRLHQDGRVRAGDMRVHASLTAFLFHAVEPMFDDRIRGIVTTLLLERVPWQFFLAPASTTGANHPAWQNPRCGLLRHVTEMSVGIWRIAQAYPELTDKTMMPLPVPMSILLAAVILHDSFKGGIPWENRTIRDHHVLAANAWKEAADRAGLESELRDDVHAAIWWHGGRWTPGWDGTPETLGTRTNIYAAVLHHCDMVYSDTNLNLLYTPIEILLKRVRRR